MKQITTILLVVLLASALRVSEAGAYGGGGFYGSGRGREFGGDEHPSLGDGKFSRRQYAFHRYRPCGAPSDRM